MDLKCFGLGMFVVLIMSVVSLFHYHMQENAVIIPVSPSTQFATITVTNQPFNNPIAEELRVPPNGIVRRSIKSDMEIPSKVTREKKITNLVPVAEIGKTENVEAERSHQYFKIGKLKANLPGSDESNHRSLETTPPDSSIKNEIRSDNSTTTSDVSSEGLKNTDYISSDHDENVTLDTEKLINPLHKSAKNEPKSSQGIKNCELDWNDLEEIKENLKLYENIKQKMIDKIKKSSRTDIDLRKEQQTLEILDKNITKLLSKGNMSEELGKDEAYGEITITKGIEGTPIDDDSFKVPAISSEVNMKDDFNPILRYSKEKQLGSSTNNAKTTNGNMIKANIQTILGQIYEGVKKQRPQISEQNIAIPERGINVLEQSTTIPKQIIEIPEQSTVVPGEGMVERNNEPYDTYRMGSIVPSKPEGIVERNNGPYDFYRMGSIVSSEPEDMVKRNNEPYDTSRMSSIVPSERENQTLIYAKLKNQDNFMNTLVSVNPHSVHANKSDDFQLRDSTVEVNTASESIASFTAPLTSLSSPVNFSKITIFKTPEESTDINKDHRIFGVRSTPSESLNYIPHAKENLRSIRSMFYKKRETKPDDAIDRTNLKSDSASKGIVELLKPKVFTLPAYVSSTNETDAPDLGIDEKMADYLWGKTGESNEPKVDEVVEETATDIKEKSIEDTPEDSREDEFLQPSNSHLIFKETLKRHLLPKTTAKELDPDILEQESIESRVDDTIPCEKPSLSYSESEEYKDFLKAFHDVYGNMDEDKPSSSNKFKREMKHVPCKGRKKDKKTVKHIPTIEQDADEVGEESVQEETEYLIPPKKSIKRKSPSLALRTRLKVEESEPNQDEDEPSDEVEEDLGNNIVPPVRQKNPKSMVSTSTKVKQSRKSKGDVKSLLDKKAKKIHLETKTTVNNEETSSEEEVGENGLPDIVYIPFKNSKHLDVKSLLLLSSALSKDGSMHNYFQLPEANHYYGQNNVGSNYIVPTNLGANHLMPSYLPLNQEESVYSGMENYPDHHAPYSQPSSYNREDYNHGHTSDRYWQGKIKRRVNDHDEEEGGIQPRKSFFNLEAPTREIASMIKSIQELTKQFKQS